MRFGLSFFAFLLVLLLSNCYSFKGTSIDPNINTFTVLQFQLDPNASNSPPTLAFDFSEQLKDKIRGQTRLQLVTENADIEFSGRVTEFNVVPVAPTANQLAELNQLWITVRVDYANNKNPEDTWTHNARQFAEFPNTADLITVQAELIRQINDRLLDDIINKAFNNW